MATACRCARRGAGILLVTLLAAWAPGLATAGTWMPVGGATRQDTAPCAPEIDVVTFGPAALSVFVDLPGLELVPHKAGNETFVLAQWPQASLAGDVGTPAVPVVRRLFWGPVGADVTVRATEGPLTTLPLDALDAVGPLLPVQPAVSMAPGAREQAAFHLDLAAYTANEFQPAQRATVRELGVVRDRGLYLLEVYPVAYNAARNTLAVYAHVDVDITFTGGQTAQRNLGPLAAVNNIVINPESAPADSPTGSRGTYLFVVAESLASAPSLDTLIAAKAAAGFAVDEYVVPSGTSAPVLKTYLQSLWGTPDAPDYILLVGDSDTIPAWTGGGDSAAPTDLPYACMDAGDDWFPDLAIGRFPVRTSDQLGALVSKTLYVEGGVYSDPDYVLRAAFLAGNDSGSGDHTAHNQVIETYLKPAGYTCEKLFYRDTGADTAEVTAAVNDGRAWCIYFGHSGSAGWSKPTFYQEDVRALDNRDLYGIVVSFSCNAGRYTDSECFGETWLRERALGSVAFCGTSTYIYWTDPPWVETADLYDDLFYSIYVDGVDELRPAWQAALFRLLAQYGETASVTRDYFEMFNTLGDPALHVLMQPGFKLVPDTESLSVCAPDDAVITIEVQSIHDFDEIVTLSAAGIPAGATVDFTVNSLPPPFTTVMTISGTGSADPGPYNVQLSGVSQSLARTTNVELAIADALPGTVLLSSPPDGETEVSRTPALTWQFASQASEYHLDIATSATFSTIVYTANVSGASHVVTVYLEPLTQYFWRVRPRNGCGVGEFSAPFSFTTLEHADYFTEQFPGSSGGFDLAYTSLTLTPALTNNYYTSCATPITEFPLDPTGGTTLSITDDGSVSVTPSRGVWLYGRLYDTLYVNANGNITFTAADGEWQESLSGHFDIPRVAICFDDFNPEIGGTISWKETPDRVAVTWLAVSEWSSTGTNSFQVEFFFNGVLRLNWLGIASNDSIVGLSRGTGVPGDFVEDDLSATLGCLHCGDGDFNHDNHAAFDDFAALAPCFAGPDVTGPTPACLCAFDIDADDDLDLADFAAFQRVAFSAIPPGAGYWRFEETGSAVLDSTGHGLTGSAPGSPPRSPDVAADTIPQTDHPNTQSINLNGDWQYVLIPHHPSLSFSNASYTIEAWVQTNAFPTGDKLWVVLKKPVGADDDEMDYAFLARAGDYGSTGNELALLMSNSYTEWPVVSSFQLIDSNWHYVSVAFDADADLVRFVFDNQVEQLAITDLGHNEPNTGPLLIGAHSNTYGLVDELWDGQLDEVRITPGVLPPNLLLNAD